MTDAVPPTDGRTPTGRWLVALVVLVVLATAGGAYAFIATRTAELDGVELDREIADQILAESGADVVVSCPSTMLALAGREYVCTTRDGAAAAAVVTVDSDGQPSFRLTGPDTIVAQPPG